MFVRTAATAERSTLRAYHAVVIEMMGPFRLRLGGEVAPVASHGKTESLLVRLAMARGRGCRREELIDHLWPGGDPSLARQSLNTLTSQVNRLCRAHLGGADLVVHQAGYYALVRRPDVAVDLELFEAWRREGLRHLTDGEVTRGRAMCERAISLYRGDLAGDGSVESVMERENLRVAMSELLLALARHRYGEGDYAGCDAHLRALLGVDPCREDAHRMLMASLVRQGRRSQALRQYRVCEQALADTYDAEPEPATVELYEDIRLNQAVRG